MKYIILWETRKERDYSALIEEFTFFPQCRLLIENSPERSLEQFISVYRDFLSDNGILIYHFGNFFVQNTIEYLSSLNKEFPELPIVIYSGGIDGANRKGNHSWSVNADGRKVEIPLENASMVCVVPERINGNLAKRLNLMEALFTLEDAPEDHLAFFDKVTKRDPIKDDLFLLKKALNNYRFDDFQEIDHVKNSILPRLLSGNLLKNKENITLLESILEQLSKRQPLSEQDETTLNELIDWIGSHL